MNSVFSFNKYIFSFLAGFWPKNLAFARKIMVSSESGSCRPPTSWLVRLHVIGVPTNTLLEHGTIAVEKFHFIDE